MSNAQPTGAQRTRVEKGIYTRRTADGREVFEIVYRDSDGRQRWEKVDGGIRAARSRRDDVAGRKARGEKVRPRPNLRFNDAADAWWTDKALKLRPNTQSAYGASLKHLRERYGRIRLDDIGVSSVARFVSEQEAKGLKGWTIKGQMTVLGRIFDHASRHLGWAGQNPVRQLDRDERPKADEREKRILSADELERLLSAVDDRYRLLFRFAASTGARLGEALGLRWHALGFDAGTVHISHQLDRRGEYVELKTKRSRRTIEIPPSLVSELRAHKLASPHSTEHDYVFASRAGDGFDHRNIGGRVMARAVKAAKLGKEERDGQIVKHAPTFHSLRHSHGSALIAAGWDLEEVSARLGHRDVTVTARIYVHAYESAKRSAARSDRLEVMYGGGSPASNVRATDGSSGQQTATPDGAEVRSLAAKRSVAQ
jgi:integrase